MALNGVGATVLLGEGDLGDLTVIAGVDYGPFAQLVGRWSGDKGIDVSPKSDAQKSTPFSDVIVFEAIGTVKNFGRQQLSALRYHQVVSRLGTHHDFHNESGYWLWDAGEEEVIQTLAIPRGVALVAGGRASSGARRLEVTAATDNPNWGIAQSPLMRDNAKTISFNHVIEVNGTTMRYEECTVLDIYGRRFDHTDGNTLGRSKGSGTDVMR